MKVQYIYLNIAIFRDVFHISFNYTSYRFNHLYGVLLYEDLKHTLKDYIISNDIFAVYFFEKESLSLIKTLKFVKQYKTLELFIYMSFNINQHYEYILELLHSKVQYLYLEMYGKCN